MKPLHIAAEHPRPRLRRALVPATAMILAAAFALVIWLIGRGGGRAATLAAPDTTAATTTSTPAPPSTLPLAVADGPALGVSEPIATAATAPPETTAPPTTEPATTEPLTTTTTEPAQNTAAIASMQTRLTELGYSVAAIDGRVGGRTSSAILAFEKVEGLDLDGEPGPQVYARLDAPEGTVAAGGSAVPRVEIDLERQVLFVVTPSGTRIFNTSTGNNEPFTWPDGTPATAYTPTGTFSVLRRVDGVDDGPLGSLYRPLYFYDGWAIPGSSYVPAYPASHGCARVSNEDQNWIWDHVANGTPVIVY